MSVRDAFREVCATAKPARKSYVSLYADQPYYGGPEEGGWWGHDHTLVAYHECSTDEEAEAIKAEVEKLAEDLSKQAKTEFGDYCRRSLEEAEAKGLYAEDLPEVDGETEYWVTIEDRPGDHAYVGTRGYE